MRSIKGMVVIEGCTYRIECSGMNRYEVVRIRDEARVGAFITSPRFEILEAPLGIGMLRAIASVAMRTGKTSWAEAVLPLTPILHARPEHMVLKPSKA